MPNRRDDFEDIRFIGIRAVEKISGFSKASILRKMKKNEFPLPVIHEGNVSRWDYSEIMKWREEKIKNRPTEFVGEQIA